MTKLVTTRAKQPEPGTLEHLEQQMRLANTEAARLRRRLNWILTTAERLGVVKGGLESARMSLELHQLLRQLLEWKHPERRRLRLTEGKFDWDLRDTSEGGDVIWEKEK
jgi:hypothetical protein